MNYILRELDNTKILLYKLFVRYLVVKPVCSNAALVFLKPKFKPFNVALLAYTQPCIIHSKSKHHFSSLRVILK